MCATATATTTTNQTNRKKPTKPRLKVISPIDRVITMLKRREPERVVDLFSEYPPCELDCWMTDDDGRTLLHRVMSFRPSVSIVDLIISRMVSNHNHHQQQQQKLVPEDVTDRYGMTPLHIAAASGASIDVIERLLRGSTVVGSVLATDSMNRLPLHWACCNPSGQSPQMPRKGLFSFATCGVARRDAGNMLMVVEKLIQAYPQAVWMVDRDGAMPFDLAADRRADTSILVTLDVAMRKTQSKKEHPTDVSNTEIDSSLDIPWEVSESNNTDMDDLSTIGTGGVSNFGRKRRVTRKIAKGLTDEERSRIHIYL